MVISGFKSHGLFWVTKLFSQNTLIIWIYGMHTFKHLKELKKGTGSKEFSFVDLSSL